MSVILEIALAIAIGKNSQIIPIKSPYVYYNILVIRML